MAFGYHWEWRAFGEVSAAFAERYADLKVDIAPTQFEDIYLWAPELQANIKVRLGEAEGLKFKWQRERRLPFELWEERPEDFYAFPLVLEGWTQLAHTLAEAGISLEEYPQQAPGLSQLLSALAKTPCRLVRVVKRREARIWQGGGGRVLVGWTQIAAPRRVTTVGLEIEAPDDDEGQTLLDLRRAIAALDLDGEEMKIMNYLEALEAWGTGSL